MDNYRHTTIDENLEKLKGILLNTQNFADFKDSLERLEGSEFTSKDFFNFSISLIESFKTYIKKEEWQNFELETMLKEHDVNGHDWDEVENRIEDCISKYIKLLVNFAINRKSAKPIDTELLADLVLKSDSSVDSYDIALKSMHALGGLKFDQNDLLLTIYTGNLDIFSEILNKSPQLVDHFYEEGVGYPLNAVTCALCDIYLKTDTSGSKRLKMLEMLIETGREVDPENPESSKNRALSTRDKHGRLPMINLLHSDKFNTEIFDLILKSGFNYDLSQRDKYGETVLHRACTVYNKPYFDLIETLLDHGASPWDKISIYDSHDIEKKTVIEEKTVIESLLTGTDNYPIERTTFYETLPLFFRRKGFDFPKGFDEERKAALASALNHCLEQGLKFTKQHRNGGYVIDERGYTVIATRKVTPQDILKEFECDPNFPNKSPHPELIKCLVSRIKGIEKIVDVEDKLSDDPLLNDWTSLGNFQEEVRKIVHGFQNFPEDIAKDYAMELKGPTIPKHYLEVLRNDYKLIKALCDKLNDLTENLTSSRQIDLSDCVNDELFQNFEQAKNVYLDNFEKICTLLKFVKKTDMEKKGQVWILEGGEVKKDGFGHFVNILTAKKEKLIEDLNGLRPRLKKYKEETEAMERKALLAPATPLSAAVEARDERSAEFLLEEGCNPNILVTSSKGFVSILSKLCDSIEERGATRPDPDEIRIMSHLIAHGADIDDAIYRSHMEQEIRGIENFLKNATIHPPTGPLDEPEAKLGELRDRVGGEDISKIKDELKEIYGEEVEQEVDDLEYETQQWQNKIAEHNKKKGLTRDYKEDEKNGYKASYLKSKEESLASLKSTLENFKSLREKEEFWKSAFTTVIHQNKIISRQAAEIAGLEGKVDALQGDVDTKDARLKELDDLVSSQHEQLTAERGKNVDLRSRVERLEVEKGKRDATLVELQDIIQVTQEVATESQRVNTIANEQLSNQQEKIARQDEDLAQKDAKIADLQKTIEALIKSSVQLSPTRESRPPSAAADAAEPPSPTRSILMSSMAALFGSTTEEKDPKDQSR